MFLIGVFLAYLLMLLGCIYAGLSPLEVIDIPSLGSGWLGVMIGAIAMLKNLGKGDLAALGIGCAAALITALYGYGFTYLFCVPAANKVKG